MGTSFHTTVLDGGVERRYFTANIDTELGIWTITGGARGLRREGCAAAWVRTRGGWGDVLPQLSNCVLRQLSNCDLFSTSNPQTKEQQFSAGGQLLNW